MKNQSVCISGVGSILPSGIGWRELWSASKNATHALTYLRQPLLSGGDRIIFGAVQSQMSAEAILPRKSIKYFSQPSIWASLAAKQAVAEAGWDLEAGSGGKLGVFACQNDRTVPCLEDLLPTFPSKGEGEFAEMFVERALVQRRLNPFVCMKSLSSNALSAVCLALGHNGFGTILGQGEGMGYAAFRQAQSAIRSGRLDAAIVICTSSVNGLYALASLRRAGLLDPAAGRHGFQPYGPDGAGVVFGEGAVALFLESSTSAARRGRIGVAEILGTAFEYGDGRLGRFRSGSYHRCLGKLGQPGPIEAVDLVVGEGRGLDDAAERAEIASIQPGASWLTSTSWVTGVIPAASELLQVAVGALAIRTATIPGAPYKIEPSAGPKWAEGTTSMGSCRSVLATTWASKGFSAMTLLGQQRH